MNENEELIVTEEPQQPPVNPVADTVTSVVNQMLQNQQQGNAVREGMTPEKLERIGTFLAQESGDDPMNWRNYLTPEEQAMVPQQTDMLDTVIKNVADVPGAALGGVVKGVGNVVSAPYNLLNATTDTFAYLDEGAGYAMEWAGNKLGWDWLTRTGQSFRDDAKMWYDLVGPNQFQRALNKAVDDDEFLGADTATGALASGMSEIVSTGGVSSMAIVSGLNNVGATRAATTISNFMKAHPVITDTALDIAAEQLANNLDAGTVFNMLQDAGVPMAGILAIDNDDHPLVKRAKMVGSELFTSGLLEAGKEFLSASLTALKNATSPDVPTADLDAAVGEAKKKVAKEMLKEADAQRTTTGPVSQTGKTRIINLAEEEARMKKAPDLPEGWTRGEDGTLSKNGKSLSASQQAYADAHPGEELPEPKGSNNGKSLDTSEPERKPFGKEGANKFSTTKVKRGTVPPIEPGVEWKTVRGHKQGLIVDRKAYNEARGLTEDGPDYEWVHDGKEWKAVEKLAARPEEVVIPPKVDVDLDGRFVEVSEERIPLKYSVDEDIEELRRVSQGNPNQYIPRLREQLGWTPDRFDAALEEAQSRGEIEFKKNNTPMGKGESKQGFTDSNGVTRYGMGFRAVKKTDTATVKVDTPTKIVEVNQRVDIENDPTLPPRDADGYAIDPEDLEDGVEPAIPGGRMSDAPEGAPSAPEEPKPGNVPPDVDVPPEEAKAYAYRTDTEEQSKVINDALKDADLPLAPRLTDAQVTQQYQYMAVNDDYLASIGYTGDMGDRVARENFLFDHIYRQGKAQAFVTWEAYLLVGKLADNVKRMYTEFDADGSLLKELDNGGRLYNELIELKRRSLQFAQYRTGLAQGMRQVQAPVGLADKVLNIDIPGQGGSGKTRQIVTDSASGGSVLKGREAQFQKAYDNVSQGNDYAPFDELRLELNDWTPEEFNAQMLKWRDEGKIQLSNDWDSELMRGLDDSNWIHETTGDEGVDQLQRWTAAKGSKVTGAPSNVTSMAANIGKDDVLQMAMDDLDSLPLHMRAQYARQLAAITDPGMLNTALSKGVTWLDKAMSWRAFSMLSGIKTFNNNFLGNAFNFYVANPVDKVVGGMLGFVKAGFKWSPEARASFEEGVAIYTQAKLIHQDMMHFLSTSMEQNDQLLLSRSGKWTTGTNVGADDSYLWSALKGDNPWEKAVAAASRLRSVPSRGLVGPDAMFQAMSQRAYIVAQATTDAKMRMPKGLGRQAQKHFIQENINKFVRENLVTIEGLEDTKIGRFENVDIKVDAKGRPQTAMGAAAQAYAQQMTFNQKMNKGSLGDDLVRFIERHPSMRLLIPFPRVTTNMAAAIAQHSPLLAGFTSDFHKAIKAGGKEAQDAWAKVIVGTTVSAGVYNLALEGFVTGSGPRNPQEREMWLAAGNKPNSFHIGDLWIPYDNMEPWATLMSTAADTADYAVRMQNDPNAPKGWEQNLDILSWGYAGGLMKALSDKSLMSGILDFAQLTADPRRFLQTYTQNIALSMEPQFVTMVRNIIDPYLREQRGFLDSLWNRTPGLSFELPPQRSWLDGQPIGRSGGWMSAVSPLYVENKEETATTQMAEKLLQYKGLRLNPGNSVNGHTYDATQEARFRELHGTIKLNGRNMIEALNRTMESDAFQRYPQGDERATEALNKVILNYRSAAKKQLLREFPELGKRDPKAIVKGWSQSNTEAKREGVGTRAAKALLDF
jgi:predicted RecB family endonuclease